MSPKRILSVNFILPAFFSLYSLLFIVQPAISSERERLLISTEELTNIIGNPRLRIIDAVDPALYRRANIPGAINIFYQTLTDIDERKKNGYPISVKEAEKIFGDAGIDRETMVVVYDAGEGVFASAVWFVLEFFGHDNVRILNGGFRKWMAEGRPVTQNVPVVEKKKFAAAPRPGMIVTKEWLVENMEKKDVIILDARSVKEYIGDDIRPGASRGGHIPGAVHFEWTNVTGKLNSFKPLEEMEKVFKLKGISRDATVVTYCHSGIGRSSDLAFVLKLLGYKNVLEYTGSWEEWSGDPRLPIER